MQVQSAMFGESYSLKLRKQDDIQGKKKETPQSIQVSLIHIAFCYSHSSGSLTQI